MKILFFISLVSGFCVSMAQNKKLEGIWVTYKQEVIGDTNTAAYAFNGTFPNNVTYEFLKDSTFLFNGIKPESYRDINVYHFYSDTLLLIFREPCDCNTFPDFPYTILQPNSNELILSDATDTNYYATRMYLKKIKKYPKKVIEKYVTIDKEAEFPGGNDSLLDFIARTIDKTLLSPRKDKYDSGIYLDLSINESGKIS